MSALISVRALSKSYASPGGRVLTVLRELELSAAPGEMIAIVGASGVGKSTLLHVLSTTSSRARSRLAARRCTR